MVKFIVISGYTSGRVKLIMNFEELVIDWSVAFSDNVDDVDTWPMTMRCVITIRVRITSTGKKIKI